MWVFCGEACFEKVALVGQPVGCAATLLRFVRKVLKYTLARLKENYFSRKGAKAQRKPLQTRQRFAPLRLCARNLLHARYFSCKATLTLAVSNMWVVSLDTSRCTQIRDALITLA